MDQHILVMYSFKIHHKNPQVIDHLIYPSVKIVAPLLQRETKSPTKSLNK